MSQSSIASVSPVPSAAPSAATEWKLNWPLVVACMIGFSFHAVMSYGIGLFMGPLQEEFGWGMAKLSAGFTISALLTVPLAPVVGAMIDKWGVRRLVLPGLVLKAVSIAVFATTSGSDFQWYALWVFYALVAMGVKSTVWIAAVSGAFLAGRGLALAVVLSGTALTQIVAPPLSEWLIGSYGWRQAFVYLGFGWGLFGLVFCYLFLFDTHDTRRRAARRRARGEKVTGEVRPELTGLGVRDALRNLPLIRVALATLITMILGIGVIVHLVPILTEAGYTRESAAYLASLAGIAGIAGKLVTGYLMDRMHAGWIGALTMSAMAVAFLAMLEPWRTQTLIIMAVVIIGYASGSKLQICAYLTGRYGGMRNFGKIFGAMASMIALGSGLGPLLAGAVHDISGSYSPLMMIGIPGALVSGLLLLGLGPYPDFETKSRP